MVNDNLTLDVQGDALVRGNENINKDLTVVENTTLNKTTTNEMVVNTKLRVPLGPSANRSTGDIWYDPNTSSGTGSGGGGEVIKSITFHQDVNAVTMYDGSSQVGAFTADNSVNEITLNGKTIKIPKGVIIGNINGDDSINIKKNVAANTVVISVKNKFVEDISNSLIRSSLSPVETRLGTAELTIKNNNDSLEGEINRLDEKLSNETSQLDTKIDNNKSATDIAISDIDTAISDINTKVASNTQQITDNINTINGINEKIYSLDEFLGNINSDVDYLFGIKNEIIERLDKIDGEEGSIASVNSSITNLNTEIEELTTKTNDLDTTTSSLETALNTLSSSVSALSNSLASIATRLSKVEADIKKYHPATNS